jgi:murein DD-endopeptidase MepM/ murein hydrolase activator NlpD
MVAAGGIVLVAGDLNDGFGLQVIVQHLPHLHTRYAHLHSIACKVGDRLAPPQLVGTVGNTGRSQGAHLHLDVMCDSPGYMTDLDPLDYLAGGWTWALSGLVPGSTGPRVRALQQLINRTLRPDRLKVDGVWGGQTTAAIRTLTAGEATVPALLRTLQR